MVAAASPSWTVDRAGGIRLGAPAQVMGILNITPDSFSDGGLRRDPAAAADHGLRLAADGAAWIDVGGESTRPGAMPVAADEELERVVPVVRALVEARCSARISIDTSKGVVARAAIAAGAAMINDVSAGSDPELVEAVAAHGCPLVLMHRQGTPADMQRAPRYRDVVDEVESYLAGRLRAVEGRGVPADRVVLDPGIGFGKTVAHNLALLRALPRLAALGRPLLVGVSRKAFIGRLAGIDAPAARDGASHLLHALLAPWCALLRVHDVAGARAALGLAAEAADV